MTPQDPLEISLVLRSTIQESMVRRSISAISVLRDTQFNLIGKPTPKLVALESIDATVVLSSLGM